MRVDWHLLGRSKITLTETISHWEVLAPDISPLPHPSPRNNRWLKRNAWFASETLPYLREQVKAILARPE